MGKHLNLSQRIIIESNLNENNSLRKIVKSWVNHTLPFLEKYYQEEF